MHFWFSEPDFNLSQYKNLYYVTLRALYDGFSQLANLFTCTQWRRNFHVFFINLWFDFYFPSAIFLNIYTTHTICSRPGRSSGLSLYCLEAGHCFNISSAGSSLTTCPLSLYFWIIHSTQTSSIALVHEKPSFCFWWTYNETVALNIYIFFNLTKTQGTEIRQISGKHIHHDKFEPVLHSCFSLENITVQFNFTTFFQKFLSYSTENESFLG